jgi:hypothetical protein
MDLGAMRLRRVELATTSRSVGGAGYMRAARLVAAVHHSGVDLCGANPKAADPGWGRQIGADNSGLRRDPAEEGWRSWRARRSGGGGLKEVLMTEVGFDDT